MLKKKHSLTLVVISLLFSVATGEVVADVGTELQQARLYRQNGKYSQAQDIYQNIIQQYPGSDYDFLHTSATRWFGKIIIGTAESKDCYGFLLSFIKYISRIISS
jgi:TolA-binding protein